MRVLHINDYSTSGGAEVQMAVTVQMLRDAGHDAELFTIDDVPEHARRLTPWRYIDNRHARQALRRTIARFKPEVAHLHNFYHVLSPGILAELRGGPHRVVITAHDYHLVCPSAGACWFARGDVRPRLADPSRLKSASYLWSRRWDHRSLGHAALKLAQHVWNYQIHQRQRVIQAVICPSRFLEQIMRTAGLPAVFLPNPIAAHASPAAHKRGDRLRMVFAGRVEPEKGLAEFLNLLPHDFAGSMTVIGEGSELHRCRRICQTRSLGDRVAFLGRIPHDEAVDTIASSHVLVLPSLWWENCPMSLLEALASRTNILVSDLGGMKEIVESAGVGQVFAPGDGNSLDLALRKIESEFKAGRLNQFDATSFLDERSAENHLQTLLAIYGAERVSQPAHAAAASVELAQ